MDCDYMELKLRGCTFGFRVPLPVLIRTADDTITSQFIIECIDASLTGTWYLASRYWWIRLIPRTQGKLLLNYPISKDRR